ncbi:MAG TPA: phosphoglycerate kinase [Planctomycetota bacterium]|nr:phosphoglycerate kinase [Planctomycetota bacterium]
MSKLSDLNVSGKRVLCRVDFNVSVDKKTGEIKDDTRVMAALPTIKYLTERGARVILCSHFGRPEGRDPKLSLKPVAARLAERMGKPVAFADDCVGEVAEKAVATLKNGDVLLLENLRYHAGEEDDDPAFAAQLAKLADVYVDDAFGAAHRAHASVHAVANLIPQKAAGLLLEKEVAYLGKALSSPEHPMVVILGGAKVSDKIKVIEKMIEVADTILIGGAMSYTFALAQGFTVGKSLVEPDKVDLAKHLLKLAAEKKKKFLLPLDHVVTEKFEAHAPNYVVDWGKIPDGLDSLDIGPKTVELFSKEIAGAKMIVWNGPLGVFELEPFNAGTFAIARAVAANTGAVSIVGGGESVAAVKKAKLSDKITHVSTGGGASLEFLEGKQLPGVKVLGGY